MNRFLKLLIVLICSFGVRFGYSQTFSGQKAVLTQSISLRGNRIDSLSKDGSFSGNSDNVLATQKAIKTYLSQVHAIYLINQGTGFNLSRGSGDSLYIRTIALTGNVTGSYRSDSALLINVPGSGISGNGVAGQLAYWSTGNTLYKAPIINDSINNRIEFDKQLFFPAGKSITPDITSTIDNTKTYGIYYTGTTTNNFNAFRVLASIAEVVQLNLVNTSSAITVAHGNSSSEIGMGINSDSADALLSYGQNNGAAFSLHVGLTSKFGKRGEYSMGTGGIYNNFYGDIQLYGLDITGNPRYPRIGNQNVDSTNWKPAVMDVNGNIRRSYGWPTTGGGGGSYTADESTLHLAATTFSIKTTYPGQSSITTVGTIGTGVWQGSSIADAYIASAATWNAKANALTGVRFVAPVGFLPTMVGGVNNENLGANVIGVCKFYLPYTITVNKLQILVTTGVAASTVQMGIYDGSGNRIISTSAISTVTTGMKIGTVTTSSLQPGFYWQAYVTNNAGVLFEGFANPGGQDWDNTIIGEATNVVSGGVMPTTLGTITGSSGNNGPFITLSN